MSEQPQSEALASARALWWKMATRKTTDVDERRGEAYLERVVANLQGERPGGRNATLSRAAWTLGRWIAAGVLDPIYVEEELYAAVEAYGLVADDGKRQC